MTKPLPLALALLLVAPPVFAAPVVSRHVSIGAVPAHVVQVDLRDPATIVDVQLANRASRANSAEATFGDEAFPALVARGRAAAMMNGTFFSKDAQKRVMGNMVSRGISVKYSRWENAGTTFGLGPGNRPEMVTAAVDGVPDQTRYWTSITAGPRLLRAGEPALDPQREGFRDPHVLGSAGRSALGFTQDGRTLILVSFGAAVTLAEEAVAMKVLGAWEAMNLDGGASRALAVSGKILVPAGRPLTNVIVVYDAKHPAPSAMKRSQASFGQSLQTPAPQAVTPPAPTPRPAAATPGPLEVIKGFGSWLLKGEKQ